MMTPKSLKTEGNRMSWASRPKEVWDRVSSSNVVHVVRESNGQCPMPAKMGRKNVCRGNCSGGRCPGRICPV